VENFECIIHDIKYCAAECGRSDFLNEESIGFIMKKIVCFIKIYFPYKHYLLLYTAKRIKNFYPKRNARKNAQIKSNLKFYCCFL